MAKHPEQDLINICVEGDLCGWDEDTWEYYSSAEKKLSPEGRQEYERQKAECFAELEAQHKKEIGYIHMLGTAPDDGVRH